MLLFMLVVIVVDGSLLVLAGAIVQFRRKGGWPRALMIAGPVLWILAKATAVVLTFAIFGAQMSSAPRTFNLWGVAMVAPIWVFGIGYLAASLKEPREVLPGGGDSM